MPELPEVETTVRGLKREILGLKIKNVWTDLRTKDKRKNDTVASPKYFAFFKKGVAGKKILSAERRAGIHPERKVSKIKEAEFKKIFQAMKKILNKSIKLGGDSVSDYLNTHGRPGKFQKQHQAYQKTGERCRKKGCKGVIIRKMINGRSAHFCPRHQL